MARTRERRRNDGRSSIAPCEGHDETGESNVVISDRIHGQYYEKKWKNE